jgi:hypothetical protein
MVTEWIEFELLLTSSMGATCGQKGESQPQERMFCPIWGRASRVRVSHRGGVFVQFGGGASRVRVTHDDVR